jgi:hypothetical protein
MKRKLLIGVIVVFGIAVAFFMSVLTAGAAIAVWIYLVWIVRKRKADLFHDQVEPETAERRLKWLKIFLWAGAILFAMFIGGFVAHNVIYGLSEMEESVSFFIALVCIYLFIIATGGGLAIFLKGRRKTA